MKFLICVKNQNMSDHQNNTSNSSAELGAPKALLRKTGERETASLFQNGFAILVTRLEA